MTTLSIVTSQMNFINCVEYISKINGYHVLAVATTSTIRNKQLKSIIEKTVFKNIFNKIIYRNNSNIKILDMIYQFVFLFKLFALVSRQTIDECVLGFYKCCDGRFAYLWSSNYNSKCKLVACDDGTGTLLTVQERQKEILNNNPFIFYGNRVLKWYINTKRKRFIPSSIHYFTIYKIAVASVDTISWNTYSFIKSNLDAFEIPKNILSRRLLFLGEPLYNGGFLKEGVYPHYIQLLSQQYDGARILYYAHPEERISDWKRLGLNCCDFVVNSLPFEIIAALLPEGCIVVSYISSVMTNLHLFNDKLIGFCLCIDKNDLEESLQYDIWYKTLQSFESVGVKLVKFNG